MSVISRRVGFLSYFLLFSCPLYLQFTCLCLMTAYFYQIYRSSRNNFHPSELGEWRWPSVLIVLLNVSLLVLNLLSSYVIKVQEDGGLVPSTDLLVTKQDSLPILTLYVVYCRVLLNGAMFIILATGLAYVTTKVASTSEARLLLETEVSWCSTRFESMYFLYFFSFLAIFFYESM